MLKSLGPAPQLPICPDLVPLDGADTAQFQQDLISEMQRVLDLHWARQEEQLERQVELNWGRQTELLEQLRKQLQQDIKDSLAGTSSPGSAECGGDLATTPWRDPAHDKLTTDASSRLSDRLAGQNDESDLMIESGMLERLCDSAAKLKRWIQSQLTVPPSFARRNRKKSRVGKFVDSRAFKLVAGLVIAANSVYLGAYADFTMKNELRRLDGAAYEEPWRYVHLVFTSFFFLEICARIAANGSSLFSYSDAFWNAFDIILMVMDLLPLVDLLRGKDVHSVPSLSHFRILRCFRVIHTYEFFRLPVFAHLRMITNAMLRSLPSFLWAVVFAGLVLYMSALGFCIGLANELQTINYGEHASKVGAMRMYFPDLGGSTLHLFMGISNGIDWHELYEVLNECHPLLGLGYVFFAIFMIFAVLNIISGMFIERAFKAVKDDRDFWILEEANHQQKYVDRVKGLFYEMDKDTSGSVSWEEFKHAVTNPHVEAYLSFIDLDTVHLQDIFNLIDNNGDGVLEISELVDGLDELKGPAKRVEVLRLLQLLNEVNARIHAPHAAASSHSETA